MSDSKPSTTGVQATDDQFSGAAAAQEAFGKYKARLAAAPVAMPFMPGFATPPSMGALPYYPHMPHGPAQPHPLGSLTERLGTMIRLGVDLVNATLASSAAAMGGGMWHQQWGGSHGCGCGCGRDPCGYDCCEVMSCGCCRPGVHGCGCGCCC